MSFSASETIDEKAMQHSEKASTENNKEDEEEEEDLETDEDDDCAFPSLSNFLTH